MHKELKCPSWGQQRADWVASMHLHMQMYPHTHTVQTSAASRLLMTASPDGPQQLCAPIQPTCSLG